MSSLSTDQISLIRKAVTEWDSNKVTKRASEELLELSLALLHHDRNKASIDEIKAEMADVHIVLKHLELKFGSYQKQLDTKTLKCSHGVGETEMSELIKKLANEYAHCYAFVADDTMPVKQAELYDAIDAIEAEHQKALIQQDQESTKVLEAAIEALNTKHQKSITTLKAEIIDKVRDLETFNDSPHDDSVSKSEFINIVNEVISK